MGVIIDTSGVEGITDFFEQFPVTARAAMANAINDTARGYALKRAKEEVYKETAFPPGYLDQPERLWVSLTAYPERLEATITGRDRPTQLSRFAAPGTPVGNVRRGANTPGVTVTVNPNDPVTIPEAFLIALKGGNVGLAIRLKPGETIRNYTGPNQSRREIFPDVFLLEGPSVDQVFRDVAVDISDDVAAELGREFIRRFNSMV
jgi:hypothetical protein